MVGRGTSVFVIALVLACPLVCGTAPALHHDGGALPPCEAPHAPHDSCGLDECFCDGSSLPAARPTFDLANSSFLLTPGTTELAQRPDRCDAYLKADDRPPRPAILERTLPLVI